MNHHLSDTVPFARTVCSLVLLSLLSTLNSQLSASPLGTAFTYQGRLTANGGDYTGNAEFQPTLWNALSGGAQVAINSPAAVVVGVTNGLFVLPLDFGANFAGEARWLEIGVRTNGGDAFTMLSPRQPLTPAPHALYAVNAQLLNGQANSAFAPASGSTAYVAKSGDTMTGTLNLPANGLVAGGNQLVLSGGNVGIGTTTPSYQLSLGGATISTKFALWEGAGTVMGLGVAPQQFQLHLPDPYNRFAFLDTPGGNELMTIKGNGNVGIGFNAPAAKLDVAGNVRASTYYNFSGNAPVPTTAAGALFEQENVGPTVSGLSFEVRTGNPGYWEFGPRLRIDSSGNVGIGTTSPGAKLNVNGRLKLSGSDAIPFYVRVNDAGMAAYLQQMDTSTYAWWVTDEASYWRNPLTFNNSGNVGIGTTTPSAKLEVQGGPIKATGGLIIENRTSDPPNPVPGQIWLRTDL
jgi:hypothetical protein